MPRLPERCFAVLSVDATLAALIGTGDDARIYESLAPQKPTYPFVVVEYEDEERPHQFGALPSIAGARLRYMAYVKTNPAGADAIGNAIYDALMGAESSLSVEAVKFEDRNQSIEWDMDTGHRVFVTSLQFHIYFEP